MNVDRYAHLHSPSGALVSMYVDRRGGSSSAVVNELVKSLKARSDRLPRESAMSVREDIGRIEALAKRMDMGTNPAWFVFASHVDAIFEHDTLPEPVRSHVAVSARPYLRPIRAVRGPISALVVQAERSNTALHRLDTELSSIGTFEADPGKDNYGGFQGYDEARATRHADEETARMWREAAAVALAEHQKKPFDFVVIAGHRHDMDPFEATLHPYLKALPTRRLVVDPRTSTPAELTARVRELEVSIVTDRDEGTVRAVLEGAHQGRPVARGTLDVLDAANMEAVDTLVVSGPYAKPGVVCRGCGWLARTGEACPSCGEPFDETDDVIGAAMEKILSTGGAVDQVSVASPLDADGVAALLRFPLPV
ncbi:MAG: hypothetical protein OEX04_01975 [Acidimicrobiia bacterium]|nr:hypothetical protein [Acidimicrobiia bacterium]